MYGPQVVKTTVKPSTAVSPAARQAALALNGLIEMGEDPAVLEARSMAVHQVVVMLLTTAGKFHRLSPIRPPFSLATLESRCAI